jgi:hypothetical protein
MIVEDFNTPLSTTHKPSRQKLNKDPSELNDSINQMDLADIYIVFHPAAAQYTFFSVAMELSPK